MKPADIRAPEILRNSAGVSFSPLLIREKQMFLESRQRFGEEQIMSAFALLSETALYGLLAFVAVTAANAEKQAGHYHSSQHLRRAGVLYALLAACQVIHASW